MIKLVGHSGEKIFLYNFDKKEFFESKPRVIQRAPNDEEINYVEYKLLPKIKEKSTVIKEEVLIPWQMK